MATIPKFSPQIFETYFNMCSMLTYKLSTQRFLGGITKLNSQVGISLYPLVIIQTSMTKFNVTVHYIVAGGGKKDICTLL